MMAIQAASRGMMAASLRLSASASNIANIQSSSAVLRNAPVAPQPPQAPQGPAHSGQSLIAMGPIDLAVEIVDQASALAAFKANVASFEAADAMMKALLDVKV